MRDDTIPVPPAPDRPGGASAGGDLNPDLIRSHWWTDEMLARADIPVVDIPFVSIGGGIGSFVTVDYLRICGVPTSAIRVFTQLKTPWESYKYPTRGSQIPRAERLRSDSASCLDNIWGFPSYAVRQAIATKSLKPLWQVAVEPLFDDCYTPKAGQVVETMEREYHRIRYPETVVKGQVRMVRRRIGGGYFTILTPPDGATRTKRIAFRSRYVHITGLGADIGEHRVLADLLDHGGAGRDPLRRLDVEPTFEVRGTRSEPGRMYASGTATLGGNFPGVDPFLGLQIAAQEIADDLARQGFCQTLGPTRSTIQWWKWARGEKI